MYAYVNVYIQMRTFAQAGEAVWCVAVSKLKEGKKPSP